MPLVKAINDFLLRIAWDKFLAGVVLFAGVIAAAGWVGADYVVRNTPSITKMREDVDQLLIGSRIQVETFLIMKEAFPEFRAAVERRQREADSAEKSRQYDTDQMRRLVR